MSPPGLSEEEPLPSIVTSDNDAEFENDDELDRTLQAEHADNDAASSQLLNGVNGHIIEEDGEEYEEETMEGQNNGSEVALSDLDGEGNENDEPGDDDGASAEEDDEQEAEEQGDESGEEDTEGVGAVKIQPGFDQEDDEDDVSAQEDGESDDDAQAESEGSNSEDDSEVEAEWEAEAAEEDEDAETAVSAGGANNCMCVYHLGVV
jgi:histone acetyltransferase SAS3